MSTLGFFRASDPLSLAAIAAECGAVVPAHSDPLMMFHAAAPLDRAGRDEVTAFHPGLSLDALSATRAGACLVTANDHHHVPVGTVALVTPDPRGAFLRLIARLHPECQRPSSAVGGRGIDPSVRVHPGALLERGVVLDPGAVIGPGAEIGRGTFIGALAVIGAGVRIGRDCAIDAHVSLAYTLVGDRVRVGAGARVGCGSCEPRLGRVIIQNDVAIGANAVIERGSFNDTILGEGCRIGALTSVASGSVIARNAVLPGPP